MNNYNQIPGASAVCPTPISPATDSFQQLTAQQEKLLYSLQDLESRLRPVCSSTLEGVGKEETRPGGSCALMEYIYLNQDFVSKQQAIVNRIMALLVV